MLDSECIYKDTVLKKSQDYHGLLKEGLAHIEQLSSEIWTDFNTHDPGITILENLCFAISELGYRTDYDVKDILTSEDENGNRSLAKLYNAEEILSCAPVTEKDLLKLIIDVEGVRMAWIITNDMVVQDDGKGGFHQLPYRDAKTARDGKKKLYIKGIYDVLLDYNEGVEGKNTKEKIKSEVLNRLQKNRNLCEDFSTIYDVTETKGVEIVNIGIRCVLDVTPEASLEEIYAEVLFRVGNYISPIAKFCSVEDLLKKGVPVDEIFSGPTLKHGFLEDKELAETKRRGGICISEIKRMITDIPGVTMVRNVDLSIPGKKVKDVWDMDANNENFELPRLSDEISKGLSQIVFQKNEQPYFADNAAVMDKLQDKKNRFFKSRNIKHNKEIKLPVGRDRQLGEYYPFQNDLPEAYMVGQNRVPASYGPERQAQSNQLKAYLMFFEQVLANYFSQLEHVHNLFAPQGEFQRSYYTQVVKGVNGSEKLFMETGDKLVEKLNEIIETPDLAAQRRIQFLDHLIARFGESLTDYRNLMLNQGEKIDDRRQVIVDQQQFIKNYPYLSSNRGVARDNSIRTDPSPLSGFQNRVYHLLGINERETRDFCNIKEPGIGIVILEDEESGYHFVVQEGGEKIFTSSSCANLEDIDKLLDLALSLGVLKENYEKKSAKNDSPYELLLKCKSNDVDGVFIVGVCPDRCSMELSIFSFCELSANEGFHLVEHVLLRNRKKNNWFHQIPTAHSNKDPYSLQFSVFLPGWSSRFKDIRFRKFIENTIRSEAPAHTMARICWLGFRQMQAFETSYQKWREVEHEENDHALKSLLQQMFSLTPVYPAARLYNAESVGSDNPLTILGKTRLGVLS